MTECLVISFGNDATSRIGINRKRNGEHIMTIHKNMLEGKRLAKNFLSISKNTEPE